MDLKEFLQAVITCPPELDGVSLGQRWFCLSLGSPSGRGWHEEWFSWPDQLDAIIARAMETRTDYNVYFSSYLFSEKSSRKEYALPSFTIQADLDNADILTIPLVPTILVKTSENRHQGFWILKQQYEEVKKGESVAIPPFLPLIPEIHETLSRRITYAIPDCDHSGWPLGRKVRLPGTYNHKYMTGPQLVEVVGLDKQVSPLQIELLPDNDDPIRQQHDADFLEDVMGGSGHEGGISEDEPFEFETGPLELLESIKSKLPAKIYAQYSLRARDRSASLWAFMLAAFRAGLSQEQVFYLAKHSANNKFEDLNYNADLELAKDVLRAQQVAQAKVLDARQAVMDARKLPGLAAEKRQYMFRVVLEKMRSEGEFIRTVDDSIWYIHRDLGRPINVSIHSDYMAMVLDLEFGLNAIESEQAYVISSLMAYSRNLPATGILASLSHYDEETESLFLHTGRKYVMKISGSGTIERVVNGAYGVVFPWTTSNEEFNPILQTTMSNWGDLLFEDCLENVTGTDRHSAQVLLETWFMFLLLRSMAMSRPIIAFFGQPGSGKSTLFRIIYALLYGRARSLGSVTSPEDFDHSVATDPFVVLDNVDTWERWLPDRLALTVTPSDITRRKLYSDRDTVILKRQALVGVSAHNPRFGRPDVADRLVLINFDRLPEFKAEGDIIKRVLTRRDTLWGGIVKDLQKVLAVPMPEEREVPQFRVEDFARIGFWINRALGREEEFYEAISRTKHDQSEFALNEDTLLVSAIEAFIAQQQKGHTDPDRYWSAKDLWTVFEPLSGNSQGFSRVYRNPINLSKKLVAMQEALRGRFVIEAKFDADRGSKVWRIHNAAASVVSSNGKH